MIRRIFLLLFPVLLGACAQFPPAASQKKAALYEAKPVRIEHGIASWYKDRRTASGERFDIHAMAAAHKKLPFGTKVRVVDLKTEKSVIVRINDRGPYIRGRVIDLTIGAARELGMYSRGIAKVRLEVLKEIPVLQKPNLRVKNTPARQEFARADLPAAEAVSR